MLILLQKILMLTSSIRNLNRLNNNKKVLTKRISGVLLVWLLAQQLGQECWVCLLTIKSGSFPSTVVILLSWLYVVSSIILVAELSFAAMEEDGVEEVSFTSLATKTLGSCFGTSVAIVYASLSFS